MLGLKSRPGLRLTYRPGFVVSILPFYTVKVTGWLVWSASLPRHAPGVLHWNACAVARRCLIPGTTCKHVVLLGDQLIDMSTTLSGGSLGSCVDEERSQLREVM